MISSGSAVQTKGLGRSLVSLRKRLMAACRSTIEWKTPRLRRRWASLAKKPSTALSQEAEVGVKMEDKAGVTIEPRANLGVLVGGVVVEDNVDDAAGWYLCFDRIEKANELLMAVTLHAAADDLAFQHVERGEQGGCAVPLVVMGHRSAAALFHRQARLGAVKRLDL